MAEEQKLTRDQKDANLLATAALTLKELEGSNLQTRRRGIMFIATLLGHKMGVEQLSDQSWGTVGQCDRCSQIGKTAKDGKTIEGRAITSVCPSRPREG